MNFKVGDRVRVKTNLKGGERYGDMYFSPDMEEYRGKEYTVIAIDKCGYYLEGVGRPFGPWSFRDEMLDPAILPVKRDWTLIVRPDKADPDTTVAILKVDGEETRRKTSKRYHKDEYSIEAAIKAVVAKMGCVDAKPPVTAEPPKPEPPVNKYVLTITDTGKSIQINGLATGEIRAGDVLLAVEAQKLEILKHALETSEIVHD